MISNFIFVFVILFFNYQSGFQHPWDSCHWLQRLHFLKWLQAVFKMLLENCQTPKTPRNLETCDKNVLNKIRNPSFLTPGMEIRNPKWFVCVVNDHICHLPKDWDQFLHPALRYSYMSRTWHFGNTQTDK